MGSFKIRQNVLMPGTLKVGSSGTVLTKLLTGTVSASVPAMGASAVGTGSAAITGLAVGDTLIMQLASYGASGIGIVTARAASANTASMTYMALGGPTTASTMTLNYIVVG